MLSVNFMFEFLMLLVFICIFLFKFKEEVKGMERRMFFVVFMKYFVFRVIVFLNSLRLNLMLVIVVVFYFRVLLVRLGMVELMIWLFFGLKL